jgi:hypothetical protein
MEAIIEGYGGELTIHGRLVNCSVCNIKIRRDFYSVNRHVDSSKHALLKRLSHAEPVSKPLEGAL